MGKAKAVAASAYPQSDGSVNYKLPHDGSADTGETEEMPACHAENQQARSRYEFGNDISLAVTLRNDYE